ARLSNREQVRGWRTVAACEWIDREVSVWRGLTRRHCRRCNDGLRHELANGHLFGGRSLDDLRSCNDQGRGHLGGRRRNALGLLHGHERTSLRRDDGPALELAPHDHALEGTTRRRDEVLDLPEADVVDTRESAISEEHGNDALSNDD